MLLLGLNSESDTTPRLKVHSLVKKTSNWKSHFSRTQSQDTASKGHNGRSKVASDSTGGQARPPQKLITELVLKGEGQLGGKGEKDILGQGNSMNKDKAARNCMPCGRI